MKTAAAAGLVPALLAEGGKLDIRIVRLKLRHTWTTTMSSSDYRDTLHVHYTRDGITGIGEGAPIVRYRESAATGKQALEAFSTQLTTADPWHFDKTLTELFKAMGGNYATKAAVDIAVMDWVARSLKLPLYRYYGLDPKDAPVTTFSIGIDTPEITKQKVREAAAYRVLKIKVGLDTDEATIAAVREVTDKPLRVDANEGWTDKEAAIRKIEWLAKNGVEFIEQPMPAAALEETRWLRDRSELPIIADEAVLRTADIPKLAEAYDGVNVKLDKCGGVREAYRIIQMAKALGLKTMLGCMISSSVSVTAAAHLSPLVDYADLDGNLLISNDPYRGVLVENGKLVLPTGPGLGLEPT
jgi:L-Ala-D/L-Glu epimerase / N-acetyl-D-glutamate racemase